jgi:hypothetical protein
MRQSKRESRDSVAAYPRSVVDIPVIPDCRKITISADA